MSDYRTAAAPVEHPALHARGVWRRFGQTVAVRDVNLSVPRGVIRGLVGENGAGKSTFLGIAAGRVRPSAGVIEIAGRVLPHGNPRAARTRGLAVTYQELALVPAADAVTNVFLGQERVRGGVLRRKAMEERFSQLCRRLQIDIPARTPVRNLSVGDQQMVEIMRGLNADASLILLDEPTSALQRHERERLFTALKDLRAAGVTSVFVSHDLDDVLELADDVTVFRNGEVVSTRPSDEWTKRDLVRAMLGQGAERALAEVLDGRNFVGKPLVSVRGLSTANKLRNLNFDIHPGEILGLGGLAGSGRSSLLRALGGVDSRGTAGQMSVRGKQGRLPRSPSAAIAAGIGLIPEDRKNSGLALGLTALENVLLPSLRGAGRFSRRRAALIASESMHRAGFDPARLDTPTRDLSGGNQQKLLLARWISVELTVLLADEPTRGVDVGAKAEILQTLRELAGDGVAVVVASSDLEDLQAIADRVLVMSNGTQVAELDRSQGDEITPESILHAAIGSAPLITEPQ